MYAIRSYYDVLRRYILPNGPTHAAQRLFILSSLRSRSFSELSTDHDTTVESNGRTFPAHWISNSIGGQDGGLVIEFDVHPSRFPFTISASEFLFVRDAQHLANIQVALADSDEYDRITSYNVCYTKLLRTVGRLKSSFHNS